MRNDLLASARRARRNPLKKRNIERVERDLKSLVADPQHVQNRDREFSGFVSPSPGEATSPSTAASAPARPTSRPT